MGVALVLPEDSSDRAITRRHSAVGLQVRFREGAQEVKERAPATSLALLFIWC